MRKLTLLVVVLALVSAGVFAATTDTQVINLELVAITTMRVVPDGAINLQISEGAITAGDLPAAVPNATTYIQYTVLSASTYRVTVQAAGTIPGGTALSITAATTTSGTGTAKGTTAGTVTIANADLPLAATAVLNNIQNCYTGTGGTDGSNITYSYAVTDVTTAAPGTGIVTLTYTIQI